MTRGWRGAPKVRGFSTFDRVVMVSLGNDPATRWLGVERVQIGGWDEFDREGRLGLRLIDWIAREGGVAGLV